MQPGKSAETVPRCPARRRPARGGHRPGKTLDYRPLLRQPAGPGSRPAQTPSQRYQPGTNGVWSANHPGPLAMRMCATRELTRTGTRRTPGVVKAPGQERPDITFHYCFLGWTPVYPQRLPACCRRFLAQPVPDRRQPPGCRGPVPIRIQPALSDKLLSARLGCVIQPSVPSANKGRHAAIEDSRLGRSPCWA